MTRRLILLAAALLLAATPALCQGDEAPGPRIRQVQALPPGHPPIEGRGGPAEAAPAGRPLHWNPKTVQDFEGKITAIGPAVETAPGQAPRPVGAMMMAISTPKGPEQVLLGPSWYLYQTGPRLKVGDDVKVTGSVVEREGQRLVLGQKVSKDGEELALRNDAGVPLWAGRYGRGAGEEAPSPGMREREPMGGRGGRCPMGGGVGGPGGVHGGQGEMMGAPGMQGGQ